MEEISEAVVTADSAFKKLLSGDINKAVQDGKAIDTDPVAKLAIVKAKPLAVLGYAYLKAKGLI